MHRLPACSAVCAVQRARIALVILVILGVAAVALDGIAIAGALAPGARAAGPSCSAGPPPARATAGRAARSGLLWLRLGDGSVMPLITADPRHLDHPSVSPDGTRIAFLAASNGILASLEVCELGRHTTRAVPLPTPASDFALSWDPHGQQLVFLGGDALGWGADQRPLAVEPSGARLRQLAGDSPWYYDGIAVSPDGSKLALLLQLKYPDGREPEQLAVLDLRTGRLERVAGSSQVAEIDAISWSPDSRRLVFSAFRPNAHGGLYVVDLATRRLTPLLLRGAGARSPAWSPDGRSIAFVRGGPRASSVWLLDLRTGRTRRLTRGGVDVAPAWAPDGKALVFVRRSPGP